MVGKAFLGAFGGSIGGAISVTLIELITNGFKNKKKQRMDPAEAEFRSVEYRVIPAMIGPSYHNMGVERETLLTSHRHRLHDHRSLLGCKHCESQLQANRTDCGNCVFRLGFSDGYLLHHPLPVSSLLRRPTRPN